MSTTQIQHTNSQRIMSKKSWPSTCDSGEVFYLLKDAMMCNSEDSLFEKYVGSVKSL